MTTLLENTLSDPFQNVMIIINMAMPFVQINISKKSFMEISYF